MRIKCSTCRADSDGEVASISYLKSKTELYDSWIEEYPDDFAQYDIDPLPTKEEIQTGKDESWEAISDSMCNAIEHLNHYLRNNRFNGGWDKTMEEEVFQIERLLKMFDLFTHTNKPRTALAYYEDYLEIYGDHESWDRHPVHEDTKYRNYYYWYNQMV